MLNDARNGLLCSAFRPISGPPAASRDSTIACLSDILKMAELAELIYASGLAQHYPYDAISGLEALIDEGDDGHCDACVQTGRHT